MPKKIILTIEQRTEHPFAGQNTKHIAVLYVFEHYGSYQFFLTMQIFTECISKTFFKDYLTKSKNTKFKFISSLKTGYS